MLHLGFASGQQGHAKRARGSLLVHFVHNANYITE